MSQQKTPIEVTNFSKGLITEVSPLNFPPDASIDEVNFVLNRDGTRARRLGLDFEDSYSTEVLSGIGFSEIEDTPVNLHRWENVANNANSTFCVVWYGNKLKFYDLTTSSVSANMIGTELVLSNFAPRASLSFASVDGRLIVVSGAEEVAVVEYNVGETPAFVATYKRILIRDLFGVSDIYNNIDTGSLDLDLRESNNVQFRPKYGTDTHVYNLRNQTWGNPRRPKFEPGNSYDPIVHFHTAAYYNTDNFNDKISITDVRKSTLSDEGVLPSNSDIVHFGMMPDAADSPPADNFFARTLYDVPLGNVEAPRGFFIIDALNRGTSRLSVYKDLMDRNPLTTLVSSTIGLEVDVNTLPQDKTPTGATVVTEFAGRVWYSGFSGEVIDGDDYSPKLDSYVMFSKLVEGTNDINKCYQAGDPTSEETPDLVDTDGGYLRISGAFGVLKMANLGSGLAVLAENGVWVILGTTTDAGFTPTGFQVSKVSNYPIASASSAVEVDNSLVYWSDDGIYVLAKDEFGAYSVNNLTQTTIQKFYDTIPYEDKVKASGNFDPYERKIRWVYGNNKELVFDMNSSAFTKNSFSATDVLLTASVQTTPYSIGSYVQEVVVNDVLVEADSVQVATTSDIRDIGLRTTKYLTITEGSFNTTNFTFSLYKDQLFKDWDTYTGGSGLDAEAYMITGYLSGGDHQREKQVPYLTTHFLQTESGLDGDFELVNQSGCLITSQWDWTNSVNSNRWGRPFQAYRLNRHYIPEGGGFENGDYVLTTKNKLRGRGKVVSLLIKTEPLKDCQILGWSMLVGTKNNV